MTSTFWDNQAERFEKEGDTPDALHEKTMQATMALLTAEDVVLDYGCATGAFSFDVAPGVRSVHGIDISIKMIELAAKKAQTHGIQNVRFSQGTIADAQFNAGDFSAVMAFNILHLVDDITRVLAHIYDLLPDDGVLISQTPCLGEHGWLLKTVFGAVKRIGLVPQVHMLRVAEVEALIAEAGFHIEQSALWDEDNIVQWIVGRKKPRS